MRTPKEVALAALQSMRGDDLERAELAFRGLSPEAMQRQYGDSGHTRAEIVQHYRAARAEIDNAIQWVEAQKD